MGSAYPVRVKFVRSFLDRWHALIREFTKFGIIGVVNTVVDIAMFNVLFPLGPLKAQTLATMVSTTTSYFMNRHWTFRHRARSGLRREYILFFLFNAVGLGITLGILAIARYGFGIHEQLWLNVVKVFATCIAMVFRFYTYRKWVFLHPKDALYEPGDPDVLEPKLSTGSDNPVDITKADSRKVDGEDSWARAAQLKPTGVGLDQRPRHSES